MRVERSHDRFAIAAVVLGLLLVAADDVADALDLDLLDEKLGLSRLALDEQGDERIVVLEHDPARDRLAAGLPPPACRTAARNATD